MIDRQDIDLSDEQQFNDALTELLQAAYESNIDLVGSWSSRNGSSYPDWDVTITEAQKPPDINRGE
ncbi:hypothetical protein [Natrinema sp. 1APR25-10V2]|uniref:hypothetical protein n=1 Tax=Natrinema sp. 1APR25-10V2 TaxID=2951081 RepID=UPI002874E00F|nr:hypothetical protein [Natrinema sp. 1APR25-10V2]MDS0476894.1 hypothetical protein [Natrinema sp. 1APR25-10V2]